MFPGSFRLFLAIDNIIFLSRIALAYFGLSRVYNEKNISTKPDKKKALTRLSGQDENKERSQNSFPQAGKGTSSTGSQHTIEIAGRLGERFPVRVRLLHKGQFDLMFRRGTRIVKGHLLFFVRPNNLGIPRIGIAAGKRYGKSVERNKARRIIREVFRRFIRQCLSGVDIVAVVRSNREELDFYNCLGDMRSGLARYCKNSAKD